MFFLKAWVSVPSCHSGGCHLPAFMDCKDVEDVWEDLALEMISMKKVVQHGIKRVVSLPNKAMFDVSRFAQWPHVIQ